MNSKSALGRQWAMCHCVSIPAAHITDRSCSCNDTTAHLVARCLMWTARDTSAAAACAALVRRFAIAPSTERYHGRVRRPSSCMIEISRAGRQRRRSCTGPAPHPPSCATSTAIDAPASGQASTPCLLLVVHLHTHLSKLFTNTVRGVIIAAYPCLIALRQHFIHLGLVHLHAAVILLDVHQSIRHRSVQHMVYGSSDNV
eukprot:COSAG02_NODE_3755_length_6279_cov_5.177832_4_plen_200_part_00